MSLSSRSTRLDRRIVAAAAAPLAAAGLLLLGAGPAAAAPAPTAAAAPAAASCANSFGNPNTCAQAVTWAKNHISTADNPNYYGLCDHVMGLAYGFPASGSTTAYAHWQAIPAADKHAGATTVPAGGLAFFKGGSSGAGHVMISVGGGKFASTDIGGAGTFTYTTIATIKSSWGETYLGWAQPWFQYNH
jgi:hypothetical protein